MLLQGFQKLLHVWFLLGSFPQQATVAADSFLSVPPVTIEAVSTCGSSIEEARRLGCHFDMMSFAYYPPDCWDAELHDQFVQQYRHSWNWTRLDGEPISVDEVLKGDHESLISTWEFHSHHCIYEWQRLVRAVALNKRLDSKDANFGHATHCGMELLKPEKASGRKDLITTLEVYYGRCGMTRAKMQRLSKYHKED